MRKMLLLWVAVSLLCGSAFAGDPADGLLQADRDFCKAVATQRLEGWMSFMAPNVVTFGGPGYKGQDEVRKSMKETFDDPNMKLTWEPTKAEMFASGNMGYTVGRFTVSAMKDGKEMRFQGTYLTVWQKQKDGSWKVVADGGAPDGA
jgi:ketosteroid isomerase-like protein